MIPTPTSVIPDGPPSNDGPYNDSYVLRFGNHDSPYVLVMTGPSTFSSWLQVGVSYIEIVNYEIGEWLYSSL